MLFWFDIVVVISVLLLVNYVVVCSANGYINYT